MISFMLIIVGIFFSVLLKNRKLSFIPEHEEESIKISETHTNGTMVKSFSPQDDIESAM